MPAALLLKSADDTRAILAGFPPLAAETVGFSQALGRVLAGAVASDEDLPPWPRSAMDGYAVRACDTATTPAILKVRGHIAMGDPWRGPPPASGETLAIPTGAAIPTGCDAVVMVEHTRPRSSDEIEVQRAVTAGENVICAGDDVHRGETILAAGRRLRPADLGVLAALGMGEVSVHRQPLVAILSTGSELVAPEAAPGPGQVRDVNGWMLAAQAERTGCAVVRGGIVGDDAALLAERCAALHERADVVLLSGGSSIGARDLTAAVFAELGAELLFHGVNVKPGRPTLLARLAGKPLFGMPGVPASAAVIFEAFVRPLLARLAGEVGAELWPRRRRARLSRSVPSLLGREDYVRVRLVGERAEPVAGANSLSALVRADGLLVVPADSPGVTEGAEVEIFLPA